MKKLFSFFLFIFSIFYTYLCFGILIKENPVYLEINKNKDYFEKKSINAKISYNEVVPGKSGRKVNSLKSFNKMNKYGKYDDSLYVFNEVKPKVTINNIYDKYITSGKKDNMVSLIYLVSTLDNIDDIINILNKNHVYATFFIDGKLLDSNPNYINKLIYSKNEVELLNYDGLYKDSTFKSSLDYLSMIKNKDNLFCYTPYKNDNVLRLCAKYKLHTIVPSIVINNDMLYIIKENLKNGLIIKMPNSTSSLNTSINYIKSCNYKIVKLETLLDE